MQVHRPINLCLTDKFVVMLDQKLQVNPPAMKYKRSYFYYLANYLLTREAMKKDAEYYSLNVQKMKREIISNIDRYIKYLIDEELLQRDFYVNGKKAYHYRLNPDLLNSRSILIKISDEDVLFNKIVQRQRNKRKNNNRTFKRYPFMKPMYNLFRDITLDFDKAQSWILKQDLTKQHSYLTSLEHIKDDRFRFFGRNDTNKRLDTNFTSLKSDLRQFIIGDFVSIDLMNSQPFLFSQLIQSILRGSDKINTISLCHYLDSESMVKQFDIKQIKAVLKIPQNDKKHISEELLNFEKSCITGRFYDDLMEAISNDNMTRSDIKKMMFAVLFSQNVIYKNMRKMVPYQKEKKMFAEYYPFIMKIAEALKQKEHSKLAIYLQRIESYVFIDVICPKLVDSGIVPLTIHDSVIVKRSDADNALEIVKSVFSEMFGVVPRFHVKPLASDV